MAYVVTITLDDGQASEFDDGVEMFGWRDNAKISVLVGDLLPGDRTWFGEYEGVERLVVSVLKERG